MDKIINKHGIDFLRWTDKDGNIWEAELDAVRFYGKECFEQMPDPEDISAIWSVTYDEAYIDFEPVTDEEWNKIINL